MLYQYKGAFYYSSEYGGDYQNGFFWALTNWLSGAYEKSYYAGDTNCDMQAGFRQVVDGYSSVTQDESDEFMRGYEDALRMFREAKSL